MLLLFGIFILCSCFNLSASSTETKNTDSKPNIVLFIVDDLGYGDLGCFGNTTMSTPNIDSLASSGTRLTHVLAASAYCTPSRAALLTGKYPVRVGMAPATLAVTLFLASRGGLPPGTTTFPKILQNSGYKTATIGKWHLGLSCNWWGDLCHHPNSQGFDYFYGLPGTNMRGFAENEAEFNIFKKLFPEVFIALYSTMVLGTISSIYIWRKKFILTAVVLFLLTVIMPGVMHLAANNVKILNGVIMRNAEVVEQPLRLWTLTKRFAAESVRYIKKQHADGNPFMLMLSFTHVHAPLVVHPNFEGRSAHGLYGDSVQEVDWAIGKVVNILNQLHIRENTIILFTSDHGAHLEELGPQNEHHGGSNFPFSGGKGMYGMEGGLRVPTILSWKGKIPEGHVLHTPSSLMDIFPTILQLANVHNPVHSEIDGKDLKPFLTEKENWGSRRSPHKFLYHYGRWDSIHAITYVENETTVWKIHYVHPKWLPGQRQCGFMCSHLPGDLVFLKQPVIYNIINDPTESSPLADSDPKYKEILAIVQQPKDDHLRSTQPISQELTFANIIWRPWLQPFCNFPYCHCEEVIEEFEV